MEATQRIAEAAHPGVLVSRVFDAPRDLMFRIWTEPRHLLRWWAPHDFTVPDAVFDARPGGRLRIDFRAPGGFVFANHGKVVEVAPPERLVFTTEYREGGKLLVESLFTVTFAEEGEGTRVAIKADVIFADPAAAESLAGMEEGLNQQIDKLELHAAAAARNDPGALILVLPKGRPVILMRRSFAAPRALVWSCFTRPEHLAAWWGPRDHKNTITAFDPRAGGQYRVEQSDPQGNRYIFFGDYLEFVPPERLVNTFAMEGPYRDKRIVNTQILEEVEGGTQLTAVSRFDSVAERDGMAASGMEWGARQSYERLEELLATLDQGGNS
jgi:uncharacterized protein YndB with AHSA1/START domain